MQKDGCFCGEQQCRSSTWWQKCLWQLCLRYFTARRWNWCLDPGYSLIVASTNYSQSSRSWQVFPSLPCPLCLSSHQWVQHGRRLCSGSISITSAPQSESPSRTSSYTTWFCNSRSSSETWALGLPIPDNKVHLDCEMCICITFSFIQLTQLIQHCASWAAFFSQASAEVIGF